MQRHLGERAFTLIEILVVMTLIAILAGIAFPSFIGVMEAARKTQAKNDEQQIVTAMNGYYTEYGKYPVTVPPLNTTDAYFGGGTAPAGATNYGSNALLFDVLRNNTTGTNSATVTLLNPRQIVFIQPPSVKNFTNPVLGVVPNGNPLAGGWYDPWGSQYNVTADCNYDNQVTNPYTDAPGGTPLNIGVITWSFSRNGVLGGGSAVPGFSSESGTAGTFSGSIDIISWQ
jgi:prepilin-type N-terminal cleavage/methylation domain-containing protein